MSGENPTNDQLEALSKLDTAIKDAWIAFGRSDGETAGAGWSRTRPEDRLVTEWAVLVGVMGNDESEVDFLLPHFPALPLHHLKGMLLEGLDEVRFGKEDV